MADLLTILQPLQPFLSLQSTGFGPTKLPQPFNGQADYVKITITLNLNTLKVASPLFFFSPYAASSFKHVK